MSGRIEWRGVQHAPHLPIPMQKADVRLQRELDHEVAAIRKLARNIPIERPSAKPNTGPAILAATAALEVDPDRAHAFKDEIYRELWVRGGDISDPAVLARLAAQAGLPELSLTQKLVARASRWQREWQESGLQAVPALVRADGLALVGLVSIEELRDFFAAPSARRR